MATIRKRNDKWQVQVRRRGFSPRSNSFDRKRDAELWAAEQEKELYAAAAQGLRNSLECADTIDVLLLRYCAEILPRKRSAHRELCMIGAIRRRSIVKAKAQTATARMFADYRDARLREVRPASVVRELGILHHLFEIARVDWGYALLRNPLRDVRRPKLPPGRARRISGEEERAILSASEELRNPYINLIIRFALATGMRAGEILSARWDDLNPEARVLFLPITKNGKPRTVPLSKSAIEALPYDRKNQSELIFPITYDALVQAWKGITVRLSIADLRFHDLRHEAISRLFELGLEVPEVMLISGHTDFRMLLRYTHLNARKLVAKLDGAAHV